MRTAEDLSQEVERLRQDNFALREEVRTTRRQRDTEAAHALRLIDENRALMAALRNLTKGA
jgi:hypothetical protein